jgi:hypothetical protein
MAAEGKDVTWLFRQAPTIISEVKLDFNEIARTNESIVNFALGSGTDVLTKVGVLERLLGNIRAAGECACSCACSCSCSCS